MTETVDFSYFVQPREDGTAAIELAVEGIDCAACIDDIEGGLKKLGGVVSARLNYTTHRLTVVWRPAETDAAGVVAALGRIGYRAHPFSLARGEAEEQRQSDRLLRCLGVAGFAAMNIMLLSVSVWSGNVTDITPETRDFFHWMSALIALPAAAYAGQPFFQSAWRAIRRGSMNMDVPISLGVTLALGMSVVEAALHAEHAYFDSAVMLLFFLLAGRYLDHAMRKKTRSVAGNLAALKAVTAQRIGEDGALVSVPAAGLAVGDRILVRSGDKIAADGVVVSGSAEVDESLVTGETLPRQAGAGAVVYAGSIARDGTLTVAVTAAGKGTLIDEVERLLGNAVEERSRYVRLADRAAKLYSPVVHATAALTLTGWLLAGAGLHDSIITAIAVLIITCPCALALAVPAVQVVAAGALFRAGVFVNSGDAIERLADIDTVVFDKTGTLTLPEPRLAASGDIPKDLLALAARLAVSSRHPLAGAIAREVAAAEPFEAVAEVPGSGVSAQVDGQEVRLGSLQYCAISAAECPRNIPADASLIGMRAGERHAVFTVRQRLRPDAVEAVQALRERGYAIRILSGDRPEAVRDIAAELGVTDWQGGLKPAEKIEALEALKREGRKVLMVGDGINDAPALAAAKVSISPITAADVTQAQADAVFLGERLMPVVDAVRIGRKAVSLMHQNLWFSVAYNAVAVPLAIAGYVTPLIAALAMSGSSVVVTLNALRARGRRAAPSAGPAPQPRSSGALPVSAKVVSP